VANLLFGVVAYFAFRRRPRFGAGRLFLWLFAFANLFLGTGYILYSGVINFGDSAVVIGGLQPAWIYRLALVLLGYWGYRFSVGLAVRDLLELIRNGSLLPGDLPRIVYPSCAAGSLLYLVASFFNPVGASLILYDGVSGACGVAIGFLLVARVVRSLSKDRPAVSTAERSIPSSIPFDLPWVTFASIFTLLFLIFMGRGIRLR
jgi:hypothetical protein